MQPAEIIVVGCRVFTEEDMKLSIKPSDLYYKYPKDILNREQPKFSGKPDPLPFNCEDLYEVIPMLEAVMTELGRDDERTLHIVEEIMIRKMPGFITIREEVFDFLVGTARDVLE